MDSRNNDDPLVLWNCFYCNNIFMDELINSGLMDLKCHNKNISCTYERIIECYFKRKLGFIKEINNKCFTKHFLNQL